MHDQQCPQRHSHSVWFTYPLRVPAWFAFVIVKLRKGSRSGIKSSSCVLLMVSWGPRAAGFIAAEGVRNSLCLADMRLAACIRLGLRSLARWGAYHEEEALLGRREFGNVVLWMRSTNMLLHGAISLLLLFSPWSALAWTELQVNSLRG